ncbi:unnamed protein product [Closterium sp. NIES-53]
MASYRSTITYVDVVPPPGANVVSGMWLYKVKRLPGAPPVIKARYVARGFSQREGVDFFQTFAPTPKMTTLQVLLHIAAQRDYELHSLDFSTVFLQGSLHEQIWLRRPPGFTGTFPFGTHPDFFPLSADPSLFVRRGLTPFFVLVYILTRFRFPFSKVQPIPLVVDHGLTAPPLDEPFESSGSYPELWYAAKRVAKYVASTSGMGLVLGGEVCGEYIRHGTCPVTVTGYSESSWADNAESLRCEAKVYAAAMAAQELRWLSFLLTDLGERPRSPPVLFADNRSVVLLCEEPRLVGKAKHIQLRYFLLREFQQRGLARMVRVVSEANTADIFTKALPPCAHQRFCAQLGLVSTGPHLLA